MPAAWRAKPAAMRRSSRKLSVRKRFCDQDAMDDVILASDVVMVARGDLGVEIGDPELVGIQKA